MRSNRFVGFAVLFLVFSTLSWRLEENQEPLLAQAGQGIPDLNILRLRALEFWQLLQQGRKQEALKYVEPSSQDVFMKRREPEFLSFRLSQIRFEADSDAVMVTVLAARVFPQFTSPLDFPIEERYVFRNGTWYVQIAESDAKIPFATKSPAVTSGLDPASIARIEQELSKVEIKPDRLDLGEARQGKLLMGEIGYRNGSSIPVYIQIRQRPPEFLIDSSPHKLNPGQTAAIKLRVNTMSMQGKIAGEIEVLLTADRVEAKRIIKVEGVTKTPVSFAPYPLVLTRSPQEIKIQNQTGQAIKIGQVQSPGEFMTVEWRAESDKLLPAGGSSAFLVRWDVNKIPRDWRGGVILLKFADTLEDGWTGARLRVRMK